MDGAGGRDGHRGGRGGGRGGAGAGGAGGAGGGCSASVLVLGQSARLGGAWVALLGGYYGRAGLCYTDFGGGVEPYDGGQPHHAAFRELAEEFFGAGRRTDPDSKTVAKVLFDSCCEGAGMAGDPRLFIEQHSMVYRRHHLTVVRAEWLLLPRRVGAGEAMDVLLDEFKTNVEIKQASLVPLSELLRAGAVEALEPVTPVWVALDAVGLRRRGGAAQAPGRGDWLFSAAACRAIEESAEPLVLREGPSGQFFVDRAVGVAICIQIDEFCINNDGFCSKNDGFCI